jgi:hypothetical protein
MRVNIYCSILESVLRAPCCRYVYVTIDTRHELLDATPETALPTCTRYSIYCMFSVQPRSTNAHPLVTGHSWQNGYVAPVLYHCCLRNKKYKQRTRAMANLGLLAATRVPPVHMNIPVPLQQPFATDPSTLMEWLTRQILSRCHACSFGCHEREVRQHG